MSIRVIHDGAIKSAIPYVRHNDEIKIPVSGWTKVDDELKQIWPPSSEDTAYIFNQATLEAFRDRVNAGETSLNGKVIADFELTGEWTPIGYFNDTVDCLFYAGIFDGGGHTIKGLTINDTSDCHGLFGYLDDGGVVKNLTLEDVSIAGSNYVGAIAARCESDTTIENCAVSGSVTSVSTQVGGIVGYSEGTITDCTNSADVTGAGHVGGIVGLTVLSTTITRCSNTGNVISTNIYGGGVAGYAEQIEITDCTNLGEIQGGLGVGGIAGGMTSGRITNCSNTGNITATLYAGGIVGYGNTVAITNCTNSGRVKANSNAGDIVGYDDGCSIS